MSKLAMPLDGPSGQDVLLLQPVAVGIPAPGKWPVACVSVRPCKSANAQMDSSSQQTEQPNPHGRSAGMLHGILTHRSSRLIVPPLFLAVLLAALTLPLWNDLQLLSEDGPTLVEQVPAVDGRDGNLIVNVKNINPNNGIATLDLTYVTENLDIGTIELWIASGGVTHKNGKLIYETDTELSRVPIVMDSPSVFVWGESQRATYQQKAEIKIDQRIRATFAPSTAMSSSSASPLPTSPSSRSTRSCGASWKILTSSTLAFAPDEPRREERRGRQLFDGGSRPTDVREDLPGAFAADGFGMRPVGAVQDHLHLDHGDGVAVAAGVRLYGADGGAGAARRVRSFEPAVRPPVRLLRRADLDGWIVDPEREYLPARHHGPHPKFHRRTPIPTRCCWSARRPTE